MPQDAIWLELLDPKGNRQPHGKRKYCQMGPITTAVTQRGTQLLVEAEFAAHTPEAAVRGPKLSPREMLIALPEGAELLTSDLDRERIIRNYIRAAGPEGAELIIELMKEIDIYLEEKKA